MKIANVYSRLGNGLSQSAQQHPQILRVPSFQSSDQIFQKDSYTPAIKLSEVTIQDCTYESGRGLFNFEAFSNSLSGVVVERIGSYNLFSEKAFKEIRKYRKTGIPTKQPFALFYITIDQYSISSTTTISTSLSVSGSQFSSI